MLYPRCFSQNPRKESQPEPDKLTTSRKRPQSQQQITSMKVNNAENQSKGKGKKTAEKVAGR